MKINSTFTGDIVPRATKWVYSATALGRDAAYTLISLFLLAYVQFASPIGYVDGVRDPALYALQFGVISIIVIIARIWDGLNDPIMGFIIERCHFKMGKYKPWILIGAITNTVVMLVLFLARPQGWAYVILFSVFYFLWDITYTMNDIGYWSMLPALTSDEKQRNDITTIMSIFISVGAFTVGGVVPLTVSSGDAVKNYGLIAIIVSIVFLASQLILVVFSKESARNLEQEKISQKTKFGDMFRLMKTNDQLRWIVIVILIYYIASNILNGLGLNYFYFSFGYGAEGGEGGNIQFLFTVMYAGGTILAQFLFPVLIKFMKRNTLLFISFLMMAIGHVVFFFIGAPFNGNPAIGVTYPILLYVLGIIIFSGQGIFYLILIIMMENTIEYNEWKTGERKEAVAFSLRPLTAKFASSAQQGIVWFTLSISGALAVTEGISALEVDRGLEFITPTMVKVGANDLINAGNQNMVIFTAVMTLLPFVLYVAAYLVVRFLYNIDEKKYAQIVKDIEQKRVAIAEQSPAEKAE
ncbi:MAG: glycoside-pentoside-hexuronide (GPH):cation symporter [Bacilli bacterium]|jgi:melibiose permease/lactose/raffinose/galactose permease